jgi:hypothetical protein
MLTGCIKIVKCPPPDVIPEPPPVVSGSVLVKEEQFTDDEDSYWLRLHYTTDKSSDEVIAFYDANLSGGCDEFPDTPHSVTCDGDAEPVGDYRVRIESSDQTSTSYVIDISVERCVDGF